jgi:hypothetical protein
MIRIPPNHDLLESEYSSQLTSSIPAQIVSLEEKPIADREWASVISDFPWHAEHHKAH